MSDTGSIYGLFSFFYRPPVSSRLSRWHSVSSSGLKLFSSQEEHKGSYRITLPLVFTIDIIALIAVFYCYCYGPFSLCCY